MKISAKYRLPRIALATTAVALFVAQLLIHDFPAWIFAAPVNIILAILWIALLWEGFRHRATSTTIQYLLSAEATYIALAVAAAIAIALGLQSDPAAASWPVVGGGAYILTVLTLVILRGWRNEKGIRWRFLATHCGLWLAVASMLFGAPDKQICRVEVGEAPTREAINEQGKATFLDYELCLKDFAVEHSESGTPQMFRAEVAIDEKVVPLEVNAPYRHKYGENIYLVSYDKGGCILQIVREPWLIATITGIAMLLLGALMLFLQGFGTREQ